MVKECVELCTEIQDVDDPINERFSRLATLSCVSKGDVFLRLPVGDKDKYVGTDGINACVFVAVSDFIPRTDDDDGNIHDGHVVFRDLQNVFHDIEENEILSQLENLKVLDNCSVFSFLLLASLQTEPYCGLNSIALNVLNIMCGKNTYTQKDIRYVPEDMLHAQVAIKQFVTALIPLYEGGQWLNTGDLKKGEYVIVKNANNEYKFAEVTACTETDLNIAGVSTKVTVYT